MDYEDRQTFVYIYTAYASLYGCAWGAEFACGSFDCPTSLLYYGNNQWRLSSKADSVMGAHIWAGASLRTGGSLRRTGASPVPTRVIGCHRGAGEFVLVQ